MRFPIYISTHVLQKCYRPSRVIHRHYAASRTGFDDYTRGREEFRLYMPKHFNFSADCFDKIANKRPQNTALWRIDDDGNDTKYSYAQLSERSKRLANGLQACGLKRGDRVLVILPRIVEWWILNLACIRAGLVLCPGTTLLTQRDISWRIRTSSAAAVIVHEAAVDTIEEAVANQFQLKKICVADVKCPSGWLELNDLMNKGSPEHEHVNTLSSELMNIYFTSGTTGSPKMTPHTHASYGLGHYVTGRYWLDLTENDVMWSNSDTGWAKTAFSNTFGPWSMGAAVFTHDTKKFDPDTTLKVEML